MHRNLSHEDIAQRFVEAKVVDFGAIAKLVTELGPTLAINNQGWHGVNFGRFHILACMLPASDVARLVGNLRGAALTAAVLESAGEASLT